MIKTAEISPCGKYRYMLSRIWDINKPLVTFVGVNPSTADDKEDDPTVRRLIEFAKSWDMGGFIIVNLFAMRSSNPKDLLLAEHPVGAFNNQHIMEAVRLTNKVVFCWGNWGAVNNRNNEVINMIPDGLCFGITKDGHPKHPLYLHSSTQLEPFKR